MIGGVLNTTEAGSFTMILGEPVNATLELGITSVDLVCQQECFSDEECESEEICDTLNLCSKAKLGNGEYCLYWSDCEVSSICNQLPPKNRL